VIDEMVEKVFPSKMPSGEMNTVEQAAAVFAAYASRVFSGSLLNVDRGQAP